MNIAATVIGYIVMLLAAIGLVLIGMAVLFNSISNKVEQYVIDRTIEYVKDQGRRMLSDEYWFQNADQRAMWIVIAEPLSRGIFPDPAKVRDTDFPFKKGELLKKDIVTNGHK